MKPLDAKARIAPCGLNCGVCAAFLRTCWQREVPASLAKDRGRDTAVFGRERTVRIGEDLYLHLFARDTLPGNTDRSRQIS